MITNFKIYERLGYNEEVAKLTDYCWNLYKQGERIIDLSEYSKNNLSIYINKLEIEEYNDKDDNTRMLVLYNNVYYKNTKNIVLQINKAITPHIISFEHEIKHIYDFIKNGGDYFKIKDKNLLGPYVDLNTTEKNLDIFLYIMYIIEMSEIEAWYHADIKNYTLNKHKFKTIENFVKISRLNKNYQYLKKNDLKILLDKVSNKDKNDFINLYYKVKFNIKKFFNLEGFKHNYENFKLYITNILKDLNLIKDEYSKEYTEEEINKFFNKFIKEVEYKKKIYLKYIGRIYSYFN
jgi:hypothetical protein